MKDTVFFDHKFLKFILVGIINTIVGSAIMFSLYNAAHLSYWFSSACNYCFTSVLSFFLNKYFTFSVRHWSAFMVIAFVLTIAFSYLMAYGISKPAMNYLLRDSPQKIRENVALFTGMCLFTGINYLGQRLIVFREVKNETE
jgi:putative flippase GtrA